MGCRAGGFRCAGGLSVVGSRVVGKGTGRGKGDAVQLGTMPTQAFAGGPDALLTALRTAGSELASAPRPSGTRGSRTEWAAVVAECQQVLNRAAAIQDEAIVALAAIEPVELDDGTQGETHRAPGHVALDAPAIVSGALTVSAVHAEQRVRTAVRLAADGPRGTDTETGLEGLH